jgi:hypothetical protein
MRFEEWWETEGLKYAETIFAREVRAQIHISEIIEAMKLVAEEAWFDKGREDAWFR